MGNNSTSGNSGQAQPQQLPKQKSSSEKLRRTGLMILGIGAVTTAVGWVMIGVGSESGNDGIALLGTIPGITVGPIMILTGLVILIVAAAV